MPRLRGNVSCLTGLLTNEELLLCAVLLAAIPIALYNMCFLPIYPHEAIALFTGQAYKFPSGLSEEASENVYSCDSYTLSTRHSQTGPTAYFETEQ